jgi:hypothetical protein
VLGHALYMKAIHGGKAKTDRIDARKIAVLVRGGMLPQAYVYPRGMRETRDLLRRRAEALVHLTDTNSQYNRPPFAKKLACSVLGKMTSSCAEILVEIRHSTGCLPATSTSADDTPMGAQE